MNKLTGFQPDPRSYKDGQFIPGSNLYGVEIELEDCKLSGVKSQFWSRKHDDSLRGDYAYEFVTDGPFAGHDLEEAIKDIKKMIISASTTSRCSVHLHIDIRSWSMKHYRSFIFHYLALEKVFVKISGNREENIFCWPYYRTGYFDPFREITYDNNQVFPYTCTKYSALNFKSISDLGSLELRIHKGTYSENEVLKWVMVISSLVEYSRNNPEFKELPEFYSGKGPIQFLEGIFGDLAESMIYPQISSDLMDGIRNAQYVLKSTALSKYDELDKGRVTNNLFDSIMKEGNV